ncbi:MAG: aminomethyl transferase family protein [Tissierellia bacterium]|nr:aminomethyl transferase family protein [Tissierellia bacterium]
MQNKSKRYLKHTPYVPYDNSCYTYVMSEGGAISSFVGGGVTPYEYTGWEDECLSWHENCFIHAGLNPTTTSIVKGPDALKLFSDNSVNSYNNFKIGRSKHVIMCDENGKIVIHGVCQRLAEDEFRTYWLSPWVDFLLSTGDYNASVENITGETFLYQLGGPRSLEVIENACQEDLHDIRFLGFKDTIIAGKKVTVYRIGMCGTLAYEVHGLTEDCLDVYDALLKAGEAFGIRKLGRNAYRVVHTEGGFPQIFYHFPFAMWDGLMEYVGAQEDIYGLAPFAFSGSAADLPYPEQLRSPIEVGWSHMVKFDHDFTGKDALEKEMENPKRTMVTLEWNHDDLLDIYRSQFSKEDACSTMKWSEDFDFYLGSSNFHIDKVLNQEDDLIGLASGRLFSPYYREMISLCSIDIAYANIGTEVTVLWGEVGTKQKKIRAKVARFPYIDKNRNEDVNTDSIPRLNINK